MSEPKAAATDRAARPARAFNWPVMGLAAVFVAYVIWVWVNDYRVSHASPNPPAMAATK